MRKFLRFIDIVIVGILLTVLALSCSIVDVVLNKNTVKKEIINAGLYEELNNQIREEIKEELRDEFANYPELNQKFDELVENTIKVNVLYDETDLILEQLYNNRANIELDSNMLIDGYMNNLKEYLNKNNIELPVEIDEAIEQLKEENSDGKVSITEDEETKDILDQFYGYKDIVTKAIIMLLIVTIIWIVLSVVISKEKLEVIYKPLIFAGILLVIIRNAITSLIEKINVTFDNELEEKIILTVKDTIISNIDKAYIAFLGVGIALMIVKILFNKKKTRKVE